MMLIVGTPIAVLINVFFSIMIANSILSPMRKVIELIVLLSPGTPTSPSRHGHRAEFGQLMDAITKLRKSIVEVETARTAQVSAEQSATETRTRSLNDMAGIVEAETNTVWDRVQNQSGQLDSIADQMSGSAQIWGRMLWL